MADLIKKNTPVRLKRVLSLSGSIFLVIGIMIGTGIFKKIAPMAASGLNENFIIAAWVVAGIVTVMGALSVSGLATLTVESGGEYEYLRIIFGNFTAFLFGWTSFTIIGSASVAAMSFLFTQSLHSILPFSFLQSGFNIKILSCLLICLLTLFNCLGTQKSVALTNTLTYFKIAGVLILIIGGFFFYKNSNGFHSSVSANYQGSFSQLTGVFFAAMLSAFWAYDGWLSVAFMTGEIKNPQRNVPVAIVTGILIVLVLYVLINIAFLKVLPLEQLKQLGQNDIAAGVVSEKIFRYYGNLLISLLILISTLGSLNGIIITYSRMYYKMAVEGYFFKKAAAIHPRYETPHMALIYAMLVSCALVFTGSFDSLTNMIVFAGFLFYALLAYGVIKMKRKKLVTAKSIGYPFVPIFFILFSIALFVNTFISDPRQTLMGVGLVLSGVPFYYYFKNRKKQIL